MVGEIDLLVKRVFRECIDRNGYEVLEYETAEDHMHVLLRTKDAKELSATIGKLKAVTALEALKKIRKNGLVRGQSAFWARRFSRRSVEEKEIPDIRKYIRNQKKKNDSHPTLPRGE